METVIFFYEIFNPNSLLPQIFWVGLTASVLRRRMVLGLGRAAGCSAWFGAL
jgi:hypothetical protein